MAIEQAINQSKVLPGPLVHGEKTTASIFSTAQLSSEAFLASLLETINLAFRQSHSVKPELLLRSQGDRLGSIDEFLTGLQDPESFVLIISRPGSHEVIATSSARRYHGPPRKAPSSGIELRNSPWNRTAEVEPGAEEWELKLMATHPSAQGQGLAKWMMALVEREIVERSKAKQASANATAPPNLRMVLCTPRELTGEFYLKRGYTKDYEVWRGEGYNFHIIHLSKAITG
jgi:GNAT superfamily N-acetyltransferase